MCLITIHPRGVAINEKELREGLLVNDEGAGYALTDGKGFMIHNRGLRSEWMLEEYLRFREAYPDELDGVFHGRLSTGTPATRGNCHPFPLNGDDNALLFHNGSLFPVPGDDPRCDSRIYADNGMMIGGELDDPIRFAAADDYITSTGSKIVVVTSGGDYREPLYIFNRSQWIVTPEGALHSNADFLGQGTGWTEWTDESGDLWRANVVQPGQCEHCHEFGCGGLTCHSKGALPRQRNETARRAMVVGHGH